VLEGVALAFADGLDVLVEKGGVGGDISVTGGGARLPYWGELLAAALNRPLTYRLGGEVGRRWAPRGWRVSPGRRKTGGRVRGAARRARGSARPALASLLASRRRTFVRLYQDLKNTFVEYAA
jgi:xylulokinase